LVATHCNIDNEEEYRMDSSHQWAAPNTEHDVIQASAAETTGNPVVPAVAASNGPIKKVIASVGVLGLLGGATFAARSFAAPSGNTPTEAVQALMEAAEKSDVIGVMEQLAPGERDLMIESGVPILEELKRLEVLSPAMNLNAVDGASFDFQGQAFTETVLRDDITAVKVSGGTITSSGTVSKIFGGTAKDLFGGTSDQKPTTENFDKTTVATVKRDGRWYVSLAYSVAEAARQSSGRPMPTATQSVAPTGASSPEEAIREMLNSVGALDARKAISLMDPDEFGALQDYAPLFLSDLEKETAKVQGKYTLTFPDLNMTSTKSGNVAKVKISKWSLDLKVNSIEGQPAQLVLDGDCVNATYAGKTSKRCGDEVAKLPEDLFGESAVDSGFTFNPSETSRNAEYTVVSRNGKWFVAPLRTVLGSVESNLRSVKPADLKGEKGPLGAFPGLNIFSALMGSKVPDTSELTMDPELNPELSSEISPEISSEISSDSEPTTEPSLG
jgi:hypothetical protein